MFLAGKSASHALGSAASGCSGSDDRYVECAVVLARRIWKHHLCRMQGRAVRSSIVHLDEKSETATAVLSHGGEMGPGRIWQRGVDLSSHPRALVPCVV